MAVSIALEEDFEIPPIGSLEEFRAWARSDHFPERGRIDYVAGRIEVDLTAEEYYAHGGLRVEAIGVLANLITAGERGDLQSGMRISSPQAGLSAEPDLVFISYETFESGRARLVSKSTGRRIALWRSKARRTWLRKLLAIAPWRRIQCGSRRPTGKRG